MDQFEIDLAHFHELAEKVRSRGYAVVVFTPEELDNVGFEPERAEEIMIERINM